MTISSIRIDNIDVANDKPFTLFGGMNVLESRDLAMKIAEHYVETINCHREFQWKMMATCY